MAATGWLEVGDGVFCRRYQPWDVSVGVVRGWRGLLVIDTRATAEEAAELLDDLRALDRRRPRWVVNTHAHFDHVGGNARFRPTCIWGHASLPAILAEAPPEHLVEREATIDLGDVGVVLRHLGRGHTAGDLVVTVASRGVVFAGDLVEESAPPSYGDDSFPLEWPAANARLAGIVRDGDRVVPGHGAVVDRAFVLDQLAGLVAVARTIRHLWVGEVPLDAALDAGEGLWPWPKEGLADAVARGYRELDVSADRGSGG